MAAERDEEQPRTPKGDEEAPDWTTWLRSRLERVSSSERKAGESVRDAPGEAGDDQQHGEDSTSPPATAPPGSGPAPVASGPGLVKSSPASIPPRSPAASASTPAPTPGSTAVEIEALRAAVTALVAGVGALADTFSGFRSVVTERLEEYSGTVLRVTKDTAAELEEHRKVHAGSTDELGRTVAEVSDRLQRLAGGMEELTMIRGDDERWAEVMGRLLDEVDAERQAGERQKSTTEGVVKRLDGLDQALQRIAAEVTEMAVGQQRITAELTEMAVGHHRVAADVAQVAVAQRSSAKAATQQLAAELDRPPRLTDAQVRLLAEAVLEVAAEKRSSPSSPPPFRPSAPPRGRRQTPLRAQRKARPSRPSR